MPAAEREYGLWLGGFFPGGTCVASYGPLRALRRSAGSWHWYEVELPARVAEKAGLQAPYHNWVVVPLCADADESKAAGFLGIFANAPFPHERPNSKLVFHFGETGYACGLATLRIDIHLLHEIANGSPYLKTQLLLS